MNELLVWIKQKILDGRRILTVEIQALITELEQSEAELQRYRRAEDDGRLVVLPCKVGSILYELRERHVYSCLLDDDKCDEPPEISCEKCGYSEKQIEKTIGKIFTKSISDIERQMPLLGKTIFLAQDEAEAALTQGGQQ